MSKRCCNEMGGKLMLMLMLLCFQALAIAQTSTSYFPFHVGDVWQSRYASGPLAYTERMDSLYADADSVIYVRFRRIDHDARDTVALWYRIKDSNLVYQDALPRPPIPSFTKLLFKLDATLGNAWTVRVGDPDTTYRDVAKVTTIDASSLFGRHISFKDIVYGLTRSTIRDTAWRDTITLASDFGVIYRYVEPRGPIFLAGAIINNVQWGYILNVHEDHVVSSQFELHQNFPNPFNLSTTIRFYLPKQATISLKIYDILGRDVQTLLESAIAGGTHSAYWDASRLGSGVYFCRLKTESGVLTRKMILQK